MDTVQNYKCLSCGAPLTFSAEKQNLHCESCGTDFTLDTMRELEAADSGETLSPKYDWEHYEPRNFTAEEAVDLSAYSCPSCGAEITGDDTTASSVCPYCGNSTIVKKQFEGALRPDFVIPFKLDKKSAVAAFEAACGKAPFLPSLFRDKRKIEEMTGIYVPFWIFDCDCSAQIRYHAERVTMWSDSSYNYTKTDHFRIFRDGNVGFANIPVDGSKKAEDAYMEAVEPYRYEDAVNFDTSYLSGFLSDKYDVSVEESLPRANERVRVSTEEAFAETVQGYNAVRPESSAVSFSNGKVRYALLPVYMLNVKYMDKMYKYAVNGQTGKVVGEYPVDKKKRNFYFAKVYGIALVVCAAAAKLLGFI